MFSPTELKVIVQAEPKPTSALRGYINFTGTLNENNFIGPDSINPFVSGNTLSAFIEIE